LTVTSNLTYSFPNLVSSSLYLPLHLSSPPTSSQCGHHRAPKSPMSLLPSLPNFASVTVVCLLSWTLHVPLMQRLVSSMQNFARALTNKDRVIFFLKILLGGFFLEEHARKSCRTD
jgi:hypothetical protein